MLAGVAVEVRRFDGAAWASESVANVLPGLPSTEGGSGGGASSFVEFHFPKGYDVPLCGAWISWEGRDYQVMGDPQPLLTALVPGSWNRPVKAAARRYEVPVTLLAMAASQDESGRVTCSPSPAWAGMCRVREAAEDEEWVAGAAPLKGALSLSAMPDAFFSAGNPMPDAALVGGRQMDVTSVAATGGAGSEVRIECVERSADE